MLQGYAKISSKTSHVSNGVQGKSSRYQVLKSIKRYQLHSTKQNFFSTLLPVTLRLFIKNWLQGWRASRIWTVNFKRLQEVEFQSIKDALSSLIQFLETESPLKMMKNAFYVTLKAVLVLMIFNFLSWILGHVEKRIN